MRKHCVEGFVCDSRSLSESRMEVKIESREFCMWVLRESAVVSMHGVCLYVLLLTWVSVFDGYALCDH